MSSMVKSEGEKSRLDELHVVLYNGFTRGRYLRDIS